METAGLAGGTLKPLDGNAVDAIWRDQPPPPLAPVVPHDVRFAGESAEAKRRKVAEGLARERIDAAVITSPDSIAWLLNIRGGELPRMKLGIAAREPARVAVLRRRLVGKRRERHDLSACSPPAVEHVRVDEGEGVIACKGDARSGWRQRCHLIGLNKVRRDSELEDGFDIKMGLGDRR